MGIDWMTWRRALAKRSRPPTPNSSDSQLMAHLKARAVA